MCAIYMKENFIEAPVLVVLTILVLFLYTLMIKLQSTSLLRRSWVVKEVLIRCFHYWVTLHLIFAGAVSFGFYFPTVDGQH